MYYQVKNINNREWIIVANDVGILYVGLVTVYTNSKFMALSEISKTINGLDYYFKELEEYFNGERKQFDWPLQSRGTSFQREVWQALRHIPYGQTRHYGHIANQIGRPNAVRAVANAIGRNPHLIITPCHRVIGKDGSLTGFSAGLDLKKELLVIEER